MLASPIINRSTLFKVSHVDWAPIMLAALHFETTYTGVDKEPVLATEKVPEPGGHLEDKVPIGTNGGSMATIGPVCGMASGAVD